MNKQQLASTIWESANQMRSKIEANEYKDFILGFIFYKYLSEKEVALMKVEGFTEDKIKKSMRMMLNTQNMLGMNWVILFLTIIFFRPGLKKAAILMCLTLRMHLMRLITTSTLSIKRYLKRFLTRCKLDCRSWETQTKREQNQFVLF